MFLTGNRCDTINDICPFTISNHTKRQPHAQKLISQILLPDDCLFIVSFFLPPSFDGGYR